MRNYFFTSEPMKIGKKEWRVVVYDAQAYLDTYAFSDYEWRYPAYINQQTGQVIQAADPWRSMADWPTYNSNDGMYAGCPKTLRRLYDQHRPEIEKALAKNAA